jgi:hypothetical protein
MAVVTLLQVSSVAIMVDLTMRFQFVTRGSVTGLVVVLRPRKEPLLT